jgi:hypothetical protein
MAISTPTRRTRSPCCARATSGHAAAAEQGDELAAFYIDHRTSSRLGRRPVYRALNLPQKRG